VAIYLHAGIIKIIIGTLHKIIITVPQMKQTIKEEQCTEEEWLVSTVPMDSGPPFMQYYIVLAPLKLLQLLSSYINYRYNNAHRKRAR